MTSASRPSWRISRASRASAMRGRVSRAARTSAPCASWVFASRVSADLTSFDAFEGCGVRRGGSPRWRANSARGGPSRARSPRASPARRASPPPRTSFPRRPPSGARTPRRRLARRPHAFPARGDPREAILSRTPCAPRRRPAGSATAFALITLTPHRTTSVHVPPHLLLLATTPRASSPRARCSRAISPPPAGPKTRRRKLEPGSNCRGSARDRAPSRRGSRRGDAHQRCVRERPGDVGGSKNGARSAGDRHWTAAFGRCRHGERGGGRSDETSEVVACERGRGSGRGVPSRRRPGVVVPGASGRRALAVLLECIRATGGDVRASDARARRQPRLGSRYLPELLVTAYGAALVLFAALRWHARGGWRFESGARVALGEGLHAFAKSSWTNPTAEARGSSRVISRPRSSAAPRLTEAWSGAAGTSAGRARGRASEPSWRRFGNRHLGPGDGGGVGGAACLGRRPSSRRRKRQGGAVSVPSPTRWARGRRDGGDGGAPTPWRRAGRAAARRR